MNLDQAQQIAQEVHDLLAPHCTRIAIAGSIRRQAHQPNDIEIVCIPNPSRLYGFVETVRKWHKLKGEPTGKYTQRRHPSGIKLDIFTATADNWGLILAIRTGSAEFSHRVLARKWVYKGYKSIEGTLYHKGVAVRVPEEEDLFRLIGIPFVQPENRHL